MIAKCPRIHQAAALGCVLDARYLIQAGSSGMIPFWHTGNGYHDLHTIHANVSGKTTHALVVREESSKFTIHHYIGLDVGLLFKYQDT